MTDEFVRANRLYDVESRTPIAHPAHHATDDEIRRALEDREIQTDGDTSDGLGLKKSTSSDQTGYLHRRGYSCLNHRQWLLRLSAALLESDRVYLNAKAPDQRRSRPSASHGSQHLVQRFRQAASHYLHTWGKYAGFPQPPRRSSDTENGECRSLTHGGCSYDIIPASRSVQLDIGHDGGKSV